MRVNLTRAKWQNEQICLAF